MALVERAYGFCKEWGLSGAMRLEEEIFTIFLLQHHLQFGRPGCIPP